MKNTRAIAMILLSLLAGAVAVWLAAQWVGQRASESTTLVVAVSTDVDPGTVLGTEMLQIVAWPSNSVPPGAFNEAKKLDGRVAVERILKGEAVLEGKLAPVGAMGGLSSAIQSGKRAISVQVNEIAGVAGYIRPGSLVDIMVNTREERDKAISKIVLERILVLAVAQDDKRDQTKPRVVSAVTLEVDPEQAEKIDLARNIGTLSLVLRNPLDRASTVTSGVHRDDLMSSTANATDTSGTAQASSSKASAPRAPVRPKAAGSGRASGGKAGTPEVIRGVQKANSDF